MYIALSCPVDWVHCINLTYLFNDKHDLFAFHRYIVSQQCPVIDKPFLRRYMFSILRLIAIVYKCNIYLKNRYIYR